MLTPFKNKLTLNKFFSPLNWICTIEYHTTFESVVSFPIQKKKKECIVSLIEGPNNVTPLTRVGFHDKRTAFFRRSLNCNNILFFFVGKYCNNIQKGLISK